MRASSVGVVVLWAVVRAGVGAGVGAGACSMLAGCERPPVTPPPPDDDEDLVVDLPSFLQDRPAIGGKWYDYSVDGHVLEPKNEAWIARRIAGSSDGSSDVDAHGFRIASVYDDDTAESGVFTLDVVHHEAGGGWSDAVAITLPADVDDGPVCLDLVTVDVTDCGGPHDLRFALQSRLSVFAGFAVAEPAVFVGDGVVVARVDGVSLGDLPDPSTIGALNDGPPSSFDSSDWDFTRFASDLPQQGRVLGAVERVAQSRWAVVDGGFGLVDFSLELVPDAIGRLRFTVTRRPIDLETFAVTPLADSTPVVVDVDPSSLPVFLSFRAADLLTPADKLDGVRWPDALPFAKDYDVVIVADGPAGGGLQLRLSPASAARRSSAP